MPETVPAVVMLTASTSRNKAVPTKSDLKKKAKQQKDLESNLNLLLPDSKGVQEEKAFGFAQAYFIKARDKLDENLFSQFIEILNGFDMQNSSVIDLYRQITPVLHTCPELSDEFLAFLLPEQAMEIGRYMDYLYITKMKDFFRKLEVYFGKQPHQMRKIYECLSRLAERPDVSLEEVRGAILPLLKGSALLTSRFLRLLPGERPPLANCSQTEFEKLITIENSTDESNANNNDWEVIKIPDLEDPFGRNRCPCKCHKDCSPLHCINCGLKFIKGRVFIQKGKVLRLAKLVFEGADRKEVLERIGKKMTLNQDFYKVRPRKRVAESSPLKNSHSSSGTEPDDDQPDNPTAPKVAKVKPIKLLKSKISLNNLKNRGEGDLKVVSTEDEPVNYDSFVILQDLKYGSFDVEEEQLERLMEIDDDNTDDSSDNYDFRDSVSGEDGQNAVEDPESNCDDIRIEEFSIDSIPSLIETSKESDAQKLITNSCGKESEFSKNASNSNRVTVSSVKEVENSFTIIDQQNIHTILERADESNNQDAKEVHKITDVGSVDCKESKDNSVPLEKNVDTGSKQNEIGLSTDVYNPNFTIISSEVEVTSELDKQASNVKVEVKSEIDIEENLYPNVSEPDRMMDAVKNKADTSCSRTEVVKTIELNEGNSRLDVFNLDPVAVSGCKAEPGAGLESERETIEDESTSWTREEDKVILQTFQQEGDSEQTFTKIARILPSRSVTEIQSRFQVLMQLLKEMACGSSQT